MIFVVFQHHQIRLLATQFLLSIIFLFFQRPQNVWELTTELTSSHPTVRTPLAFIACYVVCGVALPTDVCWDPSSQSLFTCAELDTRIGEECYAMASFALLEAHLKPHRASDVSCAILYFVRRALGVVPVWSNELTTLVKTDPHTESVTAVLRAFDYLLLKKCPQNSPSSSSSSAQRQERTFNNLNPSESESLNLHTPVSSRNRGDADAADVDSLSALISTTTLSPSPLEEEDSPIWRGATTPEDKENMNKNSKGGEVYPSPVSVIAMDSLELAI